MAAQNLPVPARPLWPLRLVAILAALVWLRLFITTAQAMTALPRFQSGAPQANLTRALPLTPDATEYTLFPFWATQTPAPTPTPSQTATPSPSPTPTLTATPTATSTSLPTPLPGEQHINPVDGQTMAYIPAGTFRMGDGRWDRPRHTVTLDAFWMGLTQVTNAQYRRCVEAGGCTKPIRKEINPHYYDPAYDNHPAVYVVWEQASAYCQWAGGRLPTEAEWERAASGDGKRAYAWGNSDPNSKRANVNHPDGGTKPVGSYPKGASPFGVFDMGGNVREWVNDWYNASYYKRSPDLNPMGPEKGKKRSLRGAAWHDPAEYSMVYSRFSHVPDSAGANRGFRCAFPEPNTQPE